MKQYIILQTSRLVSDGIRTSQLEQKERTGVLCPEKKKSDTCGIRTHAGKPNNLAGYRLNHSAKVSIKR